MPTKLKKMILGASSLLLIGGTLASCSDVIATPTEDEYDKASILDLGDDETVQNNTMKQIYDALVTEGDSNSEKVLRNILKLYSQSLYGDFWDIKNAYDSNDTTKLTEIANAHSIYHDKEGKGSTVKLVNTLSDFMLAIKKVFHGYITNTSYQERSQFIERKFYDAQVKNNYNLGDEYYEEAVPVLGSLRMLETPTSTELDKYYKNLFVTYKEYIDIAVLPDIYRDMLVSQYLYTVNYRSLGLSYARKIDVVKLAENTSYADATKKLVASYAKNVIENSDVNQNIYDFTFLDDLYKGVPEIVAGYEDSALVSKIYADAGWNAYSSTDSIYAKFLSDNGSYNGATIYKESTFGGYIADYLKIYDNTADDSSVLSDFTNSGAYTAKTGLQIKKNSLLATDDTTHGWYSQSGIGSVVPSDVSKRLFKITVANEVDNSSLSDSEAKCGYIRNGGYYMIPEKFETGTKYPYIISDSGTYYFVKVEEAVMSSKLDSSSKNYYDTARNVPYEAEHIARQIASLLGGSDTYSSDSNKYWVEKMMLIYHDTSVYEYFKKTFPSLFE